MQITPKLFVDMDGVLAKWNCIEVPTQIPSHKIEAYVMKHLYEPEYFLNLKKNELLINVLKDIQKQNIADIYILSCVLPENSDYPNSHPKQDKNTWIDKAFGDAFIPTDHRLFVPDGEPKYDSLQSIYNIKATSKDLLLDDYSNNLFDWCSHQDTNEESLRAIKYLNGINHTQKKWTGLMLPGTELGISKDFLYNMLVSALYDFKEIPQLFSSIDDSVKSEEEEIDMY